MIQTANRVGLDLAVDAQASLIEGARDAKPVQGYTHNFYRYPARFSPSFARAAIKAFTQQGDTVLDPYVGGGTSLVEAVALGRHCVGVDISQLAEFVTEAKTTLYSDAELQAIRAWAPTAVEAINMRKLTVHFADYEERGYFKHLDSPSRWRLRRAIEQTLGSAMKLPTKRLEAFARCAILRTAQWALDGRRTLPSLSEFRAMLPVLVTEMIDGAQQLSQAAAAIGGTTLVRLLNRSAAGLEAEWLGNAPKLIVTSPPYPGVHVLYHRWQVDGRKETAAPFWIANKLDGSGASYYTMGDRKSREQNDYFRNLLATTRSLSAISDDGTVFVQMVAFASPATQLPRYLRTMEEAGLEEMSLPLLDGIGDGRLWRNVPGRRWYAQQRGETPGSQEVVLFHRRARAPGLAGVRLPLAVSLAMSDTAGR